MTPEERQLLTDLFGRLQTASTAPRDPQAEAFITDAMRVQPYAPYVLSQTVIVQQHALEAAQHRIQELEAAVSQPQQETSFLGRLFGGGANPQQAPAPAQRSYDASNFQRGPGGPQGYPQQGGYAPQQGYAPQGGGYAPQQGGPWGAPSGGGGFLGSALQTATGVAGGVLAANAIEGLLGGGRGGGMFGGGSSGLFGGGSSGPREIVNNYYEGADPAGQHAQDVLQDQDQDQDDAQDAADDGGYDDNSGGGWDN